MIQRINLKKEKVLDLFFLLAPFGVSTTVINLFGKFNIILFMYSLLFIYILYFFKENKEIYLSSLEKKTIFSFFSPILLSFIGVAVAICTVNNPDYFYYLKYNLISRLSLVLLNLIVIIGLLNITRKWTMGKVKKLIKKYYHGLIIIGIIGIWQFLHFSIGIPFLNIETRTHIHGITQTTFLISNRITSLADEPSYLAPLIIDMIILSFLVNKKPILPVVMGIFILLFSYSGGGYLNGIVLILFSAIGYFKYKDGNFRFTWKQIITILLLLITCIFIFHKNISFLIYPVIGRFETLFDINKHTRLFLVVMPFYWVLEGSILNVIFGYGPKSYKFLNLTKILPNGEKVHVTSNNIFSDAVYELGYIGLIFYIIFFYRLIFTAFKDLKNNKYNLIAMLLSVHLFITSIYRADFMQPRFWIIIFIILKLIDD